ncbi:translation initiation factor 2 [Ruminococcus sp. TM10-9AT]|jgi:hypothetical protein|nr:translation initiation factor 2 [Ruminococcus sp. TM10-9AT]
MTGKYDIEVYNKRVHYHLTIKRNITVIRGDSATGKTELLRMISDYENNGISSGITEICEKRCVVVENASWKERLATLKQCIIFIDEGAQFLRSKEFTRIIKGSDNYFVLVTRDTLEQLPYSIEEIYGMRQERESQKYKNAKRIYNETYQLYNLQENEDIQPDLIVTEDSNSGYEFYRTLFGETCFSAEGKSNILPYLQKNQNKEILTIVDGAAFGPEMQRVMQYIKDTEKKIVLYAPESFEYLLLRANIIERTAEVTEKTYELADSKEYFSWEEFYTAYLIEHSRNTIYEYSKKKLKDAYLTTGSFQKILNQLPEKVKIEYNKRNEQKVPKNK